MKSTTKWILGIFISLVVVTALVVVGYLIFSQWGGGNWMMIPRAMRPWEGGRSLLQQVARLDPTPSLDRLLGGLQNLSVLGGRDKLSSAIKARPASHQVLFRRRQWFRGLCASV